ncbi:MAG TPA: flagellar biosynthetic protein FliO [Steroidobacteraceae bacterium]|nr:flagellar biosynthetic protein FliO [Steroidobacteraceae bacterium]
MNAVPPASPLSMGSLAQLSLSLAGIIALIIAVSWALKRLKLGAPRGRGDIAVIDQLSLGPRERIVLLRVGESQVLVGIGSGGLVGLTPLAAPIAVKGGAEPAPFADRLREFMKRPGPTP